MEKKALASNRRQALQLLALGASLLIIGTVILLIIKEFNAAWSFLSGGLAGLMPNAWQVLSLFKESYPSAAARIIRRLYRTEMLKFAFVALVFILLMKWTSLNVLSFVIGFLSAQVGVWLMLPILMSMKR